MQRLATCLLVLASAVGCATRDIADRALWVDLGARNTEQGIWLVRTLDGWNAEGVQGNVACRRNDTAAHGRWQGDYLYFRVSNEWAFRGSRPEVWLRVEYFDGVAGQPLYLEYDALGDDAPARYKRAEAITMTGSDRWRHHTYRLADAYFGDRENDACDFRLSSRTGATFDIHRVWAFSSEPPAGPVFTIPEQTPVFDNPPAIRWCDEENARRTEIRVTRRNSSESRAVWKRILNADADAEACVPGLESNRTYYVWARSEIEDRWTPWTARTFHTRYCPPPAPKISLPASGATVASLGALVCWEGEPHDAYACELTAGDGTLTTWSAESGYAHCGVGPLAPRGRYRVRVRLHNPHGWGEWSDSAAFAAPASSADAYRSPLRGYSPHPYGIVSDLSYDYRPVLERLSGRGINLVRAMPLNAWDVQPFLKADDGRYDLSRIDPAYLDRIRDFVAYANAKGFVVQLSVFEHCSLRHGEVNGRYALTRDNNVQGAAVTAENFASFWSRPESPEMTFYRKWAAALAATTRGFDVILEVMNEPYVDTPDNIEFHRSIVKILRDAGAAKVSVNSWNDDCARKLEPLVDYVSWHDNGFAKRDAVGPSKVLQSTDTGGWHKKSDVLAWAKASAESGYHFEHMAMSDDGDTGESDTDWAFVDALGGLRR